MSDSNTEHDDSTRWRFDYCVSNPPYQLEVGKKSNRTSNSVDIFPSFHEEASVFSNEQIMISPSTWQKSLQSGHGKWLIDNGLYSSDNYEAQSLFGKVIKKGIIVGVVHAKKGYTGDIFIGGQKRSRETPVWTRDEESYTLFQSTRDYDGEFLSGATYMTDLSNVETSGIDFSDTSEGMRSPVRMYIKAKPGKQADADFYWVEEDDVTKHIADNDSNFTYGKYNVLVQSAIFGRQSIFDGMLEGAGCVQARTYPPKQIAGRTLASIKSFDTQQEADNFCLYMNSAFVSTLLYFDYSRRTFASYVPDLGDYTDNNKTIDWSQQLDPQLRELFHLD